MAKRIIFIIGAVSVAVFALIFFLRSEGSSVRKNSGKIIIAASIYPLADLAQNIGGDLVEVHLITPGGVEPHEYEPTPRDLVLIQSADIFLYNGEGVDVWADAIQADFQKKGVHVLKMTEQVQSGLLKRQNSDIPQGKHISQQYDPHIWLDPVLMQGQAVSLYHLLSSLDSTHQALYEKNTENYSQALENLHNEYLKGLAHCRLRDIVVSHDAFSYLAHRYGIIIHAIAGISPEEEPSAARLSELSRFIKQKNIQSVFFETLLSPKLSQTLAQEVGVKVLVLNPLEGITNEEKQAGKNYDIIMKENLQNLKKAMICQ